MSDPPFPTVVDVEASRLEPDARHLEELLAQRVNAIRVRGFVAPAAAARVAATLDAGGFALRSASAPEGDTVQLFGLPLQWADADLEGYFATSTAYRAASLALWEGVDLEARQRALLGALAGAAVEPMRRASGEVYTPSTIRRLSEGGRIPPHLENHQLEFPPCAELRREIDASAVMSCFLLLASADEGGELVMYAMTPGDFDRSPSARTGQEALQEELARYRRGAVHLAPGDALVFDSGRFFHEVTRVAGPRRRWTVGGLFARARGDGRVVYWA